MTYRSKSQFIKSIQNTNAQYGMWSRGDTLILGVSGGRDSMCLLDVMETISSKEDLTLIVSHVNYGLRGSDSQRDEELVRATCENLELKCEVLTPKRREANSSENEWRKIRREFFEACASKYGAKSILLGHHRDDVAESILMHIIRGSGKAGLSGIRAYDGLYARPLITHERASVTAYCQDNKINYHEDSTNTDTKFLRNRIRHTLIPLLQRDYNPQIISSLTKLSELTGSLESSERNTAEVVDGSSFKPTSYTVDASKFRLLSLSRQRELILSALKSLDGSAQNRSFASVEEIRKFILSDKNKTAKKVLSDLIMERNGDTVKIAHY